MLAYSRKHLHHVDVLYEGDPVPQNYKVDQAATFSSVLIMDAQPKLVMGSKQQDRTRDGGLKWEAHLFAKFRQFDREVPEHIKVGMVSPTNPMNDMAPGTPVEVVDLEIGIMPDERKDRQTGEKKIVGAKVWYRCSEIRPIGATGSLRTLRAADG